MMMAVSRANINIKYSEGFRPNPKINFSFPVPVGLASIAEYSDIDILGGMDAQILKTLNLQLTRTDAGIGCKKHSKQSTPSLMGRYRVLQLCFYNKLQGKNLESEIKNDIMDNQELSESISSLELC